MSVNVLRMKNSERAGAYDVASTAAEAAKAGPLAAALLKRVRVSFSLCSSF
jgi:hypothetical protein